MRGSVDAWWRLSALREGNSRPQTRGGQTCRESWEVGCFGWRAQVLARARESCRGKKRRGPEESGLILAPLGAGSGLPQTQDTVWNFGRGERPPSNPCPFDEASKLQDPSPPSLPQIAMKFPMAVRAQGIALRDLGQDTLLSPPRIPGLV